MRAIIIGGGIGGLTTAIALRRVGVEAVVFERAGDLREIGAGISIWTNAVKALEKIGLSDAVRGGGQDGVGQQEIGGAIRTASGRKLMALPVGALERRFGPSVVTTRPHLQRALISALPEAALRLGAEFTGFRQDGSGVTALFADGTEERGDLLVGVDGLNSTVRAQLFGEEHPRYAGFTAWRGLVYLEDGPEDMGFEAWGRGEVFGVVPIGGGRFYWFATKNTPEGGRAGPDGHKAELLERFGSWVEPVPSIIRAAAEEEILRHDVYDRDPLSQWCKGRVTLLGDAAHPMTPNLGQGACQAIEDAVALAGCVKAQGDVIVALKLYEERRKDRADMIVRRSRALGNVEQIENPLLCALRNAAIWLVPARISLRQLAPILDPEA